MDGTYFNVIEFPESWPVEKEVEFATSALLDFKVKLSFCKLSRIKLEVIYPHETLLFISQPIEFVRAKRGILIAVWRDNAFKIRINDKQLNDSSDKGHFIVDSKYKIQIPLPPLESEEVENACSVWIEWRRQIFSDSNKSSKPGRISKTNEQELEEFERAIESLDVNIGRVGNGTVDLIVILPLLRSLLFWPDKTNPNYNPFLFRMAAKLDLPLPIYSIPNDTNTDMPELLNEFLRVINNAASTLKSYPTQQLMDFQEWLHTAIIVDKSSPFRLKDLIFEAANTISSVHFDEGVPIQIDLLKRNIILNRSQLVISAIQISELAVYYGKIVIAKLRMKTTSGKTESI